MKTHKNKTRETLLDAKVTMIEKLDVKNWDELIAQEAAKGNSVFGPFRIGKPKQ